MMNPIDFVGLKSSAIKDVDGFMRLLDELKQVMHEYVDFGRMYR